MSDTMRKQLLLGLLVLLIAANLWRYLGGDDFDTGIFGQTGGSLEIPPKLERVVADMSRMPRLSFRAEKVAGEQEIARNPFIFGVDRRIEQEQKQRMAELERMREEMALERQTEAQQVEAEAPEQASFSGSVIGMMRNRRDGTSMISVSLEQEIFIMREGDDLAGFRLISIGEEAVTFRALDSGHEVTVQWMK